jgi:hypothetical protein
LQAVRLDKKDMIEKSNVQIKEYEDKLRLNSK